MGTSVNQASPKTTNWQLAQNAYDDASLSISWALREVWRAAGNQPDGGDLAAQLAMPIIGEFAAFAGRTTSPAEASREISRFVSDNKVASLAADIARRAAMQSAGKENAQAVFRERLFAEATSYLVSRDIPGHVSPTGRLQTISDVRAFKAQMMDAAMTAVRNAPQPTSSQGDEWSRYVTFVVGNMRRRQR
jgi:hypothetical protein